MCRPIVDPRFAIRGEATNRRADALHRMHVGHAILLFWWPNNQFVLWRASGALPHQKNREGMLSPVRRIFTNGEMDRQPIPTFAVGDTPFITEGSTSPPRRRSQLSNLRSQLADLLFVHRSLVDLDKQRVYCACAEWAAQVSTREDADREHANHCAEMVSERFTISAVPVINCWVGVNWYATRRHFVSVTSNPGPRGTYPSLCNHWVYDPQEERLNDNITRRLARHQLDGLPLCKHCSRHAHDDTGSGSGGES